METLSKKQLGGETIALKKLYKKFKKVNKSMQKELEKRGYELCDLGTSNKCYTCSGNIGKKHFANNDDVYFGIGIYNRSVKMKKTGFSVNVYRAWVKKIN